MTVQDKVQKLAQKMYPGDTVFVERVPYGASKQQRKANQKQRTSLVEEMNKLKDDVKQYSSEQLLKKVCAAAERVGDKQLLITLEQANYYLATLKRIRELREKSNNLRCFTKPYRVVVARSGTPFCHVKAEGDSMGELYDQLKKKG